MTDLIAAYAQHLRAAGRGRGTIGAYERLLRCVDRDLPLGLEQATVEELAAWLACDEWAPATRALYYTGICGFFGWACDRTNPILDWNPAASLTRPKVPAGVPDPVVVLNAQRPGPAGTPDETVLMIVFAVAAVIVVIILVVVALW